MVDQYWRKTMAAVNARPNLLEFVSEVDNLLKGFVESNKILDLIQKVLPEPRGRAYLRRLAQRGASSRSLTTIGTFTTGPE